MCIARNQHVMICSQGFLHRRSACFRASCRAGVFSQPARRAVRFAGCVLLVLTFLPGVFAAEAASGGVFFQQQAADGKARAAGKEDAGDARGADVAAQRVAGRVPCEDGVAAGHPCKEIDLLAVVPREDMAEFPCPSSSGVCFNDIWGWTDPQTGVEYALLGRVDGVAFFDLRDPTQPVFVGMLPMTPGTIPQLWRDIKVVNDHAVIVADAVGAHGMQVFDLAQLRDVADTPATFEPTVLYDAIGSAHNVAVNAENDHVYIVGTQGFHRAPFGFSCGGGPHIVDMSDPAQPAFAGCYNSSVARGYAHDAQCVRYRGPDARYAGKDVCFSFDERGGAVTDVTNPASPEEIGVFHYPNMHYTHQGWLTEDQRYLFVNDELDETSGTTPRTRTLIYDVQELDDPVFAGHWYGPTNASDHNLYIREGRLYEANYMAGLRVMAFSGGGEVSSAAVREIAYFDTHPDADEPGYSYGVWSSYPFFESGVVIVSDMHAGLYVLEPTWNQAATSAEVEELPAEVMLLGNYPNPFNPETTIRYSLPESAHVRLAAYDLAGREVAVLVDSVQSAGEHSARFDGRDLPSGSYVYRLQVGEKTETRSMTLVK